MLRSTPEFLNAIQAEREREAGISTYRKNAPHRNPSKMSRIRRRVRYC